MQKFRMIEDNKLSSLNELFAKIIEKNKDGNMWFRGQNNANYDLQPSGYRKLYKIYDNLGRPVEPELVTTYSTRGDYIFLPTTFYVETFYKYMDKANIKYDMNANKIEKKCLAQHYGVMTSLLD
jgi:hypothetical protein